MLTVLSIAVVAFVLGLLFLPRAKTVFDGYIGHEKGKRGDKAMEWVLLAGIAVTGVGILVGLYLPILAAQFVVPEKI